jgi:hypothetical protein
MLHAQCMLTTMLSTGCAHTPKGVCVHSVDIASVSNGWQWACYGLCPLLPVGRQRIWACACRVHRAVPVSVRSEVLGSVTCPFEAYSRPLSTCPIRFGYRLTGPHCHQLSPGSAREPHNGFLLRSPICLFASLFSHITLLVLLL